MSYKFKITSNINKKKQIHNQQFPKKISKKITKVEQSNKITSYRWNIKSLSYDLTGLK